ncbi:hypothetical protein LSH36_1120g01052 [Paralvinella palmiformis]|uniref:MENTAL domain-containing protein n=1 Tax=Paralvinella palmiformis TaxID=53620 RepID=A0AAD9IVH3_9ANNE|nr:hypothetical protein LSH36_1120g01052 [Paralvinella palmiformis]
MESRNVQARTAGEIIYRSLSLSGDQRVRRPVPWDNQACCGIMSPVRRTFCLIVTFDLIFIFTLWVLYTQIITKDSSWDQFINEVVHYTFKHSLFDTVLCAAWRAVPLLLAYGLFRIRNPSVVAVTTFVTCVFVLSKVFLYKFDGVHGNVMCYLLLIISFIISWIEVWFLDFKVLPREEKIRQQEAHGIYVNERTPLLGQNHVTVGDECADQYYSPRESYTPTPHENDEGFVSKYPHKTLYKW